VPLEIVTRETILPEPLHDKVNRLAWRQEQTDARMNQGDTAFSELRQSIHTMNLDIQSAKAPKPFPWTWLAGFMLSVLLVTGTTIWTFAKYPDDKDFAETKKESASAHERLTKEMSSVVTEQRLIKQTQGVQKESLKKIDGKLDLLLMPPRDRAAAMAIDP